MKRYHQLIAWILVMFLLTCSISLYLKYLQNIWKAPIWSVCDTWWNFKMVRESNQYIKMCNTGDIYKIRTYIYK